MKFKWARLVLVCLFITYVSFFMATIYMTISTVEPTKSAKSPTSNGLSKVGINVQHLKHKLPPINSTKDLPGLINSINRDEKIVNLDKFDAIKPDATVIVIQVHKRIQYLKELIDSLSSARHIASSLLVFSHDLYDDSINKLISQINFCPVLQIFYPSSIQLNPHQFPGQDENDCPRDIEKKKALEIKCNNAYHPDMYGHYREAKVAQIKHHWWWKINKVMDGLKVTSNHQGYFLFLEEDHFVSRDILHMLELMKKERKESCNILTLGNYAVKWKASAQPTSSAEYHPWISSQHNMGMAMSKQTWKRIKECSDEFCSFDDYNWDWTLQQVSSRCLPAKQKLVAMMVNFPRVFHIGQCGTHHNKKDCSPSDVVREIQQLLASDSVNLFPEKLIVQGNALTASSRVPSHKPNGGWGDVRDHRLCHEHSATASLP